MLCLNRRFAFAFAIFCVLLFVGIGCSGDDPVAPPPVEKPDPKPDPDPDPKPDPKPDVDGLAILTYSRFLDIYQSGNYVERIAVEGDSTRVYFSTGQTAAVHTQKKFAQDITGKEKPVFAKNDGSVKQWLVNTQNSGVAVVSSVDLIGRTIVALYYTPSQLSLFLDNGYEMNFGIGGGSDGIVSIKIDPFLNTYLSQAIVFEQNGDYFTSLLPNDPWISTLKPTIVYRGKSLKIGNKMFKNGSTFVDFKTSAQCILEKNDGTFATYTLVITSSKVPRVYLTTNSGADITSKDVYVAGKVVVEDPFSVYTADARYEGAANLRGRGNSTWGMPKKPYKIKLDTKARLLGMSKDRQWTLLANYADKSLMRNVVAFRISNLTDLCFTPKSCYVDLFLNGIYKGCYTLTEQVQVSGEHVDITPASETGDVRGDYFLEMDERQDGDYKFNTHVKNRWFVFKEPETVTTPQRDYVKEFVREFENRLYSDDFLDARIGYKQYIDLESFVDHYIIQELTKNVDGNMRLSTFFKITRYDRPADDPIRWGSLLAVSNVWDFDLTLGNCNYLNDPAGAGGTIGGDNGPEGWFLKLGCPWYEQLFKDPEFVSRVKVKWQRLKPQFVEFLAQIDRDAEFLQASQRRNFNLWSILGVYIWPNVVAPPTYQGEIDYLKDFLSRRITWMDNEINKW